MAENSNGTNTTIKEKSISDGDGEGKKSWLEKQIEKIVGGQKDMQPIIKTCLSFVGFIGGFVAGYFIFGKEKDKKIHEQELEIMELKQRSREQEKEMRQMAKELEESKAKTMRTETEKNILKESENEQPAIGMLNGAIPIRTAERTYLD